MKAWRILLSATIAAAIVWHCMEPKMKQFSVLTLIAATLLVWLASCSNIDAGSTATKLPVQFATLKLIEQSSDITAQDVIDHVERVRGIVERDSAVTTANLVAQVMAGIAVSSLSPADRLLLQLLIDQSATHLEELNLISDERVVSILALLDWIEQAARMAG